MKTERHPYRLPPAARIRRHREFQRVMAAGRRVGDRRLQLWVLPNGLPYSRLGLVVGRKHGGAVQRNRLKRLIREAFRLTRPELPEGLDIACAPRVGVRLDLPGIQESLRRLVARAAGRNPRDAH